MALDSMRCDALVAQSQQVQRVSSRAHRWVHTMTKELTKAEFAVECMPYVVNRSDISADCTQHRDVVVWLMFEPKLPCS